MPRQLQFEGLPVLVLPAQPCSTPEQEEQTRWLIVQAGRGGRLIVDLSGVASFNARLLGVLASAWSRLGARPGEVALCVPGVVEREMFEVTHLDRLFVVCGTLAEAARELLDCPGPLLVKAG